MKNIILTGDRPTGPLHIGHYVGSLRNRVLIQNEGNYDDAEAEYNYILQKDENNADAHYGLGLIYESKGDSIKARAEWRKCLKIQFNHPGALKKMS